MKLIHCADLHLDARMESGLSGEKAGERRLELLRTFTRMVEYAAAEEVDAVLLCGDLFDMHTVSVRARNCVLDAVWQHPKMNFYYLQGNHDRGSFVQKSENVPQNLKVFEDNWVSYEQGEVTITGVELPEEGGEALFEELRLDADRINIVMLHGTAAEYGQIPLKKLCSRNIDYLALGHIHRFRLGRLDERGIWCYSGCLEGRGFDECGEKGFVQLDIRQGKVRPRFVPFAQRSLHEVRADISGLLTQEEIRREVQGKMQEIPACDMVKLILAGAVPPDSEKDAAWLEKWLEDEYYFLRVKDETKLAVRPEEYRYDVSLKGEFVRLVLDSAMTEEDKEQVIRLGLRALSGEV